MLHTHYKGRGGEGCNPQQKMTNFFILNIMSLSIYTSIA